MGKQFSTRSRRTRAAVLAIALVGAVVAVGPDTAHAASVRYTRGDAEAMLKIYPRTEAQLFQQDGLDIRPFPEVYADVIYCVQDWHVMAFATFYPEGPDPFF